MSLPTRAVVYIVISFPTRHLSVEHLNLNLSRVYSTALATSALHAIPRPGGFTAYHEDPDMLD